MRHVRRTIGAMLIFSIALGFATTIPAAELAALKLVPADALAVVIVNNLAQANQQATRLTGEMQIPAPDLLSLLKMHSGIREGVDDRGTAVLAFMPGAAEDSPPVAVTFVPITDYQKFVGQFKPADATAEMIEAEIGSQAAVVAHKGDFAIIAAQSARDTLKKVLSNSKSVDSVVGSLDAWVGGQSISFVATPTGVKWGIAAGRKVVAQMKAVLENSNDPSTKMAARNLVVYEQIFETADKELTAFAAGLHVDDDGGLHIDSRAVFVPGGSWTAIADGLEPSADSRLACLPGGPFMFVFDGAMPKSFSKQMLNMSVDMINNSIQAGGGKKLTEEQSKQLDDLMEKSMGGLRSMSMVMGPPKPGQSMYSNMAAVMKVKDARQYLTDYQAAMEKMRDIFAETSVPVPFVQDIKKTKVDGADGLEMTMDMMAMFKNMPSSGAATQMLQMMVGPDGKLTAYIVPIDDTTVAFTYVNVDNIARIKAACQNPKSSLASDAEIAQTAKLLPSGAQWVGYVSPKGFLDFISTIMSAAMPAGKMPPLPEFPQCPPVGYAALQSSKGLDLQIIFPGDALRVAGAYVKKMSGPNNAPPAH